MEIKPVKNSKIPNYPTLETYIREPEALLRHLPSNWLKNRYVATSIVTFILCANPDYSKSIPPNPTVLVDTVKKDQKPEAGQTPQDSVKVAPIFVHGDGSGSIGCIVISPPVFISEDDARKIIVKKLKEEGFSIDTGDTETIKFQSNQIAISCESDEEIAQKPKVEVSIKLDGYDSRKKIAIEYVSTDDYLKFADQDQLWMCSVTTYRTKKAAEIIRQELVNNNNTNAVVFYDPITNFEYKTDANLKAMERSAKEEAKKLLLEQVEDFINWVKTEKLLEQ